MLNVKPCSTPICSSVKLSAAIGSPLAQPTVYRNVIGALQYLTYTRPDISFVVNRLSQFLSSPNDIHWQACKHILRYLKGTSGLGLVFRPAASLHLEAFADADWASCVDDRHSTSGCCVFLGPNLINWYSRKQQVVSKSSTKAKYRALSQAASGVLWLKSLFLKLGVSIVAIPVLWCDNLGAGFLAKNLVFHNRTKYIEIDINFMREKILAGQLSVQYVPTDSQTADVLTKALLVHQFLLLRDKLHLVSSPKYSLRGYVKMS
ncbi:hypothetical protein ACOSQ2_017847 [Xanthoceras sorbifolium]